jgi:hypothetical protein
MPSRGVRDRDDSGRCGVEVIVEPDAAARLLIVVTAYAVG